MQEEIIDTTWFSLGTSLKRPASLPLIKKSAGKSARFLQSIHLARKGALVEMGDGGSSVDFESWSAVVRFPNPLAFGSGLGERTPKKAIF